MESVILENLAGLGVGCVLGLVIFFMYRRECKNHREQMREDRKYMEDRLTKLLEDDHQSREENTRALTELTTLLIRMNGKKR
jgi:hypothetical protein